MQMTKPIIILDSCCDLPAEYFKERQKKGDIARVELSYILHGTEYHDDSTVESCERLYAAMRKGEQITTSQVNNHTFKETFLRLIPEGRPIIYPAFSSALSGTFQAANTALREVKQEYPEADITVVDTFAASLGEGLLAYYLVEMQEAGKSKEEILGWLEQNKLRLNHWFTVDDLNHLKRGGRISATTALLGTMLSIKPVMWMDRPGRLVPVSKERGRKKSLNALFEKFEERVENPSEQYIFISHGDCLEDATYLADLIKKKYAPKMVFLNLVGPVIGSHSGPGTVALFFLGKERKEGEYTKQ
ncbi:MAG: DegV family protein [Clostridia bacterium]|jgi:DegV family protein with EDD domain|nr:DegV family protein [Clostridia bacterium]MDD4571325.1 DegV family protein [Clostridia bacterium]